MEIIWKGSPNFTKGRAGNKPLAVVLHIMQGTLTGTDAWFKNPISDAASHFGIGKKGQVHQYVLEENAAWCNGIVDRPTWKKYDGKTNPNLTTLSIEHEGNKDDVWTDEMKNASAQLVYELCTKWNIPLNRDNVIGHYQIRASKPDCPAKNKKIIDEIIKLAQDLNNEEEIDMTKELKKVYVRIVGEDPGDKMNEGEEKKLAKSVESLESTIKTLEGDKKNLQKKIDDAKKVLN